MNHEKQIWNDEHRVKMQAFSALKLLIFGAVMMGTFTSNVAAKQWVEDIQSDQKMDTKTLAKFLKNPHDAAFSDNGVFKKDMVGSREMAHLIQSQSLGVVSDAWHGTIETNPVAKRFLMGKAKTASELINQWDASMIIANYAQFQTPANLDLNWMLFYTPVDMRGATWGKVIDFIGNARFEEIVGNDRIKYSQLGQDSAVEFFKRSFGGGHSFDIDAIENNAALSLNDAITSLRLAAEVRKATEAYSLLETQFETTTSFNTTPTGDIQRVVETINDGARVLKDKFIDNKLGVTVSEDSLIYILSHPDNRRRIDRAMGSKVGEDGTNETVVSNIQVIYSRKIPATLGGKLGAQMIIPNGKIMMATFKDMATNQESDFDSQRVKVGAIEKYSPKVLEVKQITRIHLAV